MTTYNLKSTPRLPLPTVIKEPTDRDFSRRMDAAIRLVQHRRRLLRLATDALQHLQAEITSNGSVEIMRHD